MLTRLPLFVLLCSPLTMGCDSKQEDPDLGFPPTKSLGELKKSSKNEMSKEELEEARRKAGFKDQDELEAEARAAYEASEKSFVKGRVELTVALRDDRFQGQSSLRTYVATFTRHKCIDRLRARGRRTWVPIDDLDLRDSGPSALERLAGKERVATALQIREEMPESCRELWKMLAQGLHYREMSERLEVSEVTLRSRVLRCRKKALKARKEFWQEEIGETWQRNPSSDD